MNITFILGNGFDMQCGLETSYSDFLKKYTIIRSNDNYNIRTFKNYLLNNNQELWSDAEIAMGVHLKYFYESNIEYYIERIENFELHLIDYLLEQQSRCSWDRVEDVSQIFQKFILESVKDTIPLGMLDSNIEIKTEDIFYNFITFNYTNLLENIINCVILDKNKSPIIRTRYVGDKIYSDILACVYYVHGKLDSSIIMGVNDDSQLEICNDLNLSNRLKKLIVKTEMSENINHIWDAPAKQAIHRSDLIFIYGVSFGLTDNTWWEAIRKWLKENIKHKIVVFFKDEDRIPDLRLVGKANLYGDAKRLEILRKLGYMEDYTKYEQLLKQIYIIVNTSRLNLSSIILCNL